MESIRLRAAALSYWEVSSLCAGVTSTLAWRLPVDVSAFGHVGHFTTRGRASIKKAQTMANDLAVNLVPSSEPPSINKTETEANVAYVFVKKKDYSRMVKRLSWFAVFGRELLLILFSDSSIIVQ